MKRCRILSDWKTSSEHRKESEWKKGMRSDSCYPSAAEAAVNAFVAQVDPSTEATYLVEDEETLATEEITASYADLTDAVAALSEAGYEAPDPAA